MAKKGKYNKITLSPEEEKFLRENYQSMTNRELADALGMKITRTRTFLYEMGLKRMEMEYWTEEQIEFLKANYKRIGDTEMAEIFEKTWPKNKKWSKKHIEKKRRYLKLKRTAKQIEGIKKRAIKAGVYAEVVKKMWQTRGVTPVGEIHVWKRSGGNPLKVIKTEDGFAHLCREVWKKHHGEIPEGMVVTVKDGNTLNLNIDNLELMDRGELAQINKNNLFGMPPEMRTTVKLINKLKKEIKNHEHTAIK